MRNHLLRVSAVLLSLSFAGCTDAPVAPSSSPADDTSEVTAADTTTCTQTELCCANVGLASNPLIAAVLRTLGISTTANEVVGLACSVTDPLTCNQTSVCCSSTTTGLGGTIGLNCTVN